jgi:hypothetical protein
LRKVASERIADTLLAHRPPEKFLSVTDLVRNARAELFERWRAVIGDDVAPENFFARFSLIVEDASPDSCFAASISRNLPFRCRPARADESRVVWLLVLCCIRDTSVVAREDSSMANVNIPVRLAPEFLDQPTLSGWQLSLFSVDLGGSSDPEIEKAAVRKIGSHGKQIGHLAEALEVVINEFELLEKPMAKQRHDALQIFMGGVAAARRLKSR